FGRGYYDGATISTATATQQTQAAVTASAVKSQAITDAKRQSTGAGKRASDALQSAHVDTSCPPGLCPVSHGLSAELRAAFAPASTDASK
ncbi:hypothetical protein, partial [Streptococcus pneumoniae]|uniref:hypothetical protein n=1 Tax=Streptococcus pneumoniae TaxID=1313 RepID=UPI001E58240B